MNCFIIIFNLISESPLKPQRIIKGINYLIVGYAFRAVIAGCYSPKDFFCNISAFNLINLLGNCFFNSRYDFSRIDINVRSYPPNILAGLNLLKLTTNFIEQLSIGKRFSRAVVQFSQAI